MKKNKLWRSILIGGGIGLLIGLFYTFTAGYIYWGNTLGVIVGIFYIPFYVIGLPLYFLFALIFKSCGVVPTPKWCETVSAVIINLIFVFIGKKS